MLFFLEQSTSLHGTSDLDGRFIDFNNSEEVWSPPRGQQCLVLVTSHVWHMPICPAQLHPQMLNYVCAFFFFFLLYALILCENVFLPVWPAWSNSLKCYLLHGGGNVSHSTFSAATKSAVSSLTDVCYCHQYAEIMVQACALVKDQIVNGL